MWGNSYLPFPKTLLFSVFNLLLWASLFNFDVSVAIYCCIFAIFMVDTYMRISSIQKTIGCLGRTEQINLWSKACVKNRFSFNFSTLSIYWQRFGKKSRMKSKWVFLFSMLILLKQKEWQWQGMVWMLKKNPLSFKILENSWKWVFFTELPNSLLVWITVYISGVPLSSGIWLPTSTTFHFVCLFCKIILCSYVSIELCFCICFLYHWHI